MVEHICISHGYRPIASALQRPSSGVVVMNSIKHLSKKIPVFPPYFNGSLGFVKVKVSKFQTISNSCGGFFLETKAAIQI